MWYEKSYRRHLCDMHIDDWDERFLSEFEPEDYFENLKKAKIDNAMIYFQSHVGLCYFPTKAAKMHNALIGNEDKMQRLVNLCRENGIRVTGYYSLIYNNWAHDNHRDWRMVDITGKSKKGGKSDIRQEFANNDIFRYGLCCPNNAEYRSFVKEQIKEMADYFTVDGMFFDMLFWPHDCYCESCKKRWEKEVGGKMPEKVDWDDKNYLTMVRKRREWMGEFASWAASEAKKIMPGITVEHNVACMVGHTIANGCAEEVNDASDYAGGDLYGDSYNQSFVCKFYKNITKNQPFEYMFSKCENLKRHTSMKSEDEMLSSAFLTSAHHGATLVIDAIDPVGTLDYRLYERLGEVFAKVIPYEKYYSGKMIEDVGVYFSLKSKFKRPISSHANNTACLNAVKTFSKNNINCGVTGGFYDLYGYKALICPCLTEQDDYDVDRIENYVKTGGAVYISGGECRELIHRFFGAEYEGYTKEHVVYIAPEERYEKYFEGYTKRFPLHFDGYAPIYRGFKEECAFARLTLPYTAQDTDKFASIHSNPPGERTDIVCAAATEYGKGRVFWSAMPIEGVKLCDYEAIFTNIVKEFLCTDLTVTSTAPEDVEITAFEDDDKITVNAVVHSVRRKAHTVLPFEIAVKTEKRPKSVVLLPGGENIDFEYIDGKTAFKTRELNIFDMYMIKLK